MQLAADLTRHVAALRVAAGLEPGLVWQRERQTLLEWLRAELLPHATAEEAALYPAAADRPGGRLLLDAPQADLAGLLAGMHTLLGATEAAAGGCGGGGC